MTNKEILKKIEQLEKEGKFDQHVTPFNVENHIPVDNFAYFPKGWLKFSYFIQRMFIVRPFIFYINKLSFRRVKVKGKKNIKGIKKAVLISNHVDMFECLVIRRAFKFKKLNIVAAELNNFSGFLGNMMRIGGMWPMSSKLSGIRRFNDAIEKRINDNGFVLFYPEQSMWYHYDKPRPFKNGAFHYAIKHNVCIIPMFITYVNTNKVDKEGIMIRRFILNIEKPIYADESLPRQERLEKLKEESFNSIVGIYEKTYNKKLNYTTNEK